MCVRGSPPVPLIFLCPLPYPCGSGGRGRRLLPAGTALLVLARASPMRSKDRARGPHRKELCQGLQFPAASGDCTFTLVTGSIEANRAGRFSCCKVATMLCADRVFVSCSTLGSQEEAEQGGRQGKEVGYGREGSPVLASTPLAQDSSSYPI
ncbi:hypothetical protein FKM82_024803 [Ascaphus truei]